ncbi:MAG: hypothetical protein V4692_05480, partial [Bdellovibrionota bacterium]
MNALLVYLALSSSMAFAASSVNTAPINPPVLNVPSPEQCFPFITPKPPFYVSTSSDDRNFEDIKVNARSSAVAGYVPRGSIVKLQQPMAPLLALNPFSETLVDVTITSVPNPRTDEIARRAPAELRDPIVGPTKRLDRVKAGRTGAVPRKFLRAAGDDNMLFIVERDSPLVNIPGLAGRAIRPAKVVGGYRITRCCSVVARGNSTPLSFPELLARGNDVIEGATGANKDCRDKYIFDVMKSNMENVDRTIEIPQCDVYANNLRPVDPEHALGLSTIARTLG